MPTRSPRSRTKALKKAGIVRAIDSASIGTTFNIWLFRSPKTGRELQVGTDSHFLRCLLLESDSTCRTYETGKSEHTWKDGRKVETKFECEVVRVDKTVEFLSQKSYDIRNIDVSPSEQEEELLQRSIAESHGVKYVRVYRNDLWKWRTWISAAKLGVAAINAARSHSLHSTYVQLLALFRQRRYWSVAEVFEQFDIQSHGLAMAVLFKAIFSGEIQSDLMHSPFGRSTLLQKKNEEEVIESILNSSSADAEEIKPENPSTFSEYSESARSRPRYSRVNSEIWDDLENLPVTTESALAPEAQDKYIRLRGAITAYIQGGNATAVAKEAGISRTELYRHIARMKQHHPDGRIWGWRALHPHTRVVAYTRTMQAPYSEDEWSVSKSGFAGAFTQLLNAYKTTIHDPLIALALKKGKNRQEPRINAGDFHAEFIRLCNLENIPRNRYPFNTSDRAESSCRELLNNLRQQDFETGARILGGIPALTRSRVATGEESLIAASLPYETVIQDGHTIDFLGCVSFPHPSGPRRVPLRRCRIEIVVEVKSLAILGYVLVFKPGTNSSDALAAVENALSKWRPIQLPNPPMKYPPGSGFPSGVIPELEGAAWSTMLLDNASAYTSEAMVSELRSRVGCPVNFGPVGDFTRRYLIEGVNSALAKRGFQRMPSTTGSGHKDTRRDSPEELALEVSHEEFAYIVDVVLASHNANLMDSLAGRSPLQYLAEMFSGPGATQIARRLPKLAYGQADLDTIIIERTVRGNQSEGRRPYVEFKEVHYTNTSLSSSALMIGKVVYAHIRRKDLRQFEIFAASGESLGFVKAAKGWSLVKHDLQQRLVINDLIRHKTILRDSHEDWVQAYLRHLSQRAVSTAAKSTKHRVSTDASMVAQIVSSSALAVPEVEAIPDEAAMPLRPMTLPEPAPSSCLRPKRKAIY